jgi:signal peptidase I
MFRRSRSVTDTGRVNLLTIAVATAALAAPPHTRQLEVPSTTMRPTLAPGATVLADYDAYDSAAPRLDDIVVFHPPLVVTTSDGEHVCGDRVQRAGRMCSKAKGGQARELYLKRIVGLPGDRLSLRKGRLRRNGRAVDEAFIDPCGAKYDEGCDFPRAITVPKGRYFLLGDNRGSSYDSRFWGPVTRSALVARVDRCDPQPRVGCPARG